MFRLEKKILNEDCPQDSDWEFVIEQTPSPAQGALGDRVLRLALRALSKMASALIMRSNDQSMTHVFARDCCDKT